MKIIRNNYKYNKFYLIDFLIKMFCKIIFIILLIYCLIAIILIYQGFIKTLQIKYALKRDNIKVVLSFTATPYRIEHIKPVLDSIKQQSIKPDQIYVNIPWKFKRENKSYIIPKWLKADNEVIINRTEDYGPATKLLATLEKERNPSTIIITIDDDIVYPKHTIRDLIEPYFATKTTQQAKAVFTGFGLNAVFAADHSFYAQQVMLHLAPSLFVMGFGGVAYKREFFQDDIFALIKSLPLSCFLSDDLTISMYLYSKQIDILKSSGFAYNFVLQTLFPLKMLSTSYEPHALSKGANGIAHGGNEANYYYCLDSLSHRKNTKKLVDQFLNKNKFISNKMEQDSFFIARDQLYHKCLITLIEKLPLLKTMIMKCALGEI